MTFTAGVGPAGKRNLIMSAVNQPEESNPPPAENPGGTGTRKYIIRSQRPARPILVPVDAAESHSQQSAPASEAVSRSANPAPPRAEDGARAPAASPRTSQPAPKPEVNLTPAGGRLSAAELERLQEMRGSHPGDKYVVRPRSYREGFRRTGPGHLEALPGTGAPSRGFGYLLNSLKRIVTGDPLSTAAAEHQRLNKVQALAIYSSDALSSVAYATEAVLGALLVAGSGAFGLNIGVSLAIATLIGILIFSYRQTIYAYPMGGGSYIVAKDNLGTLPGLVAAASLLTDYVLTVSVSISAGALAIYSLVPELHPYRVQICLVAIGIILLLNLRGIREAGTAFSVPTYAFLAMIYSMLGFGLYQLMTGTLGTVTDIRDRIPPGDPHTGQLQAIGLVLVLSAFSSGCTALTGIEAISDGVPAFKKPESRNAAQTMLSLGLLLGSMFLGISFLADKVGAYPSTTESILSQVGRTVFAPLHITIGGQNLFWFLLQWATALILVLAANTSFADFPRLAFFLARDRFLPHFFGLRGDRLAFNVGIGALAILSSALIILFAGDTTALLPLYAIGVFSSFTLSQSAMVRRWLRLRTPGWQRNAIINGIGATTTFLVLLILCWTKFAEGQTLFTIAGFDVNVGAWIVIALVPVVVFMFLRIHRHYARVAKALSLEGVDVAVGHAAESGSVLATNPLLEMPRRELSTSGSNLVQLQHLIVMPVAGLNRVTLGTLAYARSLTSNVVAVHISQDEAPEQVAKLEAKWHTWVPDVPLVIIDSPYRSLLRPLLAYIDALRRQQPERVLTVLIPEFVASKPWEYVLHNQSALRLKGALLFRPGIVVTSMPYHIDRLSELQQAGQENKGPVARNA